MKYYFTNRDRTVRTRLFSRPLRGWQIALLFITTFCSLAFGATVHVFNMKYKILMISDLKGNGWNVYPSLSALHNDKETV